MALTCIIVDDEPLAVRLLESFVIRTPDLEMAGSFTDSVEAINAIKEQQPDLLFLDIQMPDLNGMELAHMLPEGTKVIFTTAFKEYAYESYEVSALDFLLKPIRYNKFITAVEKAREWYGHKLEKIHEPIQSPIPGSTMTTNDPSTVFLRVDGEYRQLTLSQVLYVEGMKDYVLFYLEGQKRPVVTHLTMKSVEDMLPASHFMRVHRSYIVALDKIRSVDRNDCIYIGEQIIRVTETYHDKFTQYLNSKSPGNKS